MQCRNVDSLDMFAMYVQEREGGILLREEHGFAIYREFDDFAYLQDVYVLPEYRQMGVGKKFVLQAVDIARKSNKKALLTTTDVAANGATESAISILKTGFKILKTEDTMIWYILEI